MLEVILDEYLKRFPKDGASLKVLIRQLANHEKLDDRENYTGHIAVSGLIFAPGLKKILQIYHPTFERWQQPGGHLEPGEEPRMAALRESIEETGVQIDRQLGDLQVPIYIESHSVPTQPPKYEPKHLHHNFWYVFIAKSDKLKLEDDVIKDARWKAVEELEHPAMKKALARCMPLLKA